MPEPQALRDLRSLVGSYRTTRSEQAQLMSDADKRLREEDAAANAEYERAVQAAKKQLAGAEAAAKYQRESQHQLAVSQRQAAHDRDNKELSQTNHTLDDVQTGLIPELVHVYSVDPFTIPTQILAQQNTSVPVMGEAKDMLLTSQKQAQAAASRIDDLVDDLVDELKSGQGRRQRQITLIAVAVIITLFAVVIAIAFALHSTLTMVMMAWPTIGVH